MKEASGLDDATNKFYFTHGHAAVEDFSPMEAEMVAQARLITNAKYEMREQNFKESLDIEVSRVRWGRR